MSWILRQPGRGEAKFAETCGGDKLEGKGKATSLLLVHCDDALLVTTDHFPPRRTIDSTRPKPGTTSPLNTPISPLGPSKIAVPSTTSLSTQLSILLVCVDAGVTFAPVAGAVVWRERGARFVAGLPFGCSWGCACVPLDAAAD